MAKKKVVKLRFFPQILTTNAITSRWSSISANWAVPGTIEGGGNVIAKAWSIRASKRPEEAMEKWNPTNLDGYETWMSQ